MSRLEKIAIFYMVVVLITFALAATTYLITDNAGLANQWNALFVLLVAGKFWYKRKDKADWDEREHDIGRKANIIGFSIFWIIFLLAVVSYGMSIRQSYLIPIDYIFFVPVMSVYLLIMPACLAIFFLSRADKLNRLKFYPTVLLSMLPLLAFIAILGIKMNNHAEQFGGNEVQEWRITEGENIDAISYITLTKWPDGNAYLNRPVEGADMIIELPYKEARLEKITYTGMNNELIDGKCVPISFADRPVPAEELSVGKYRLEIPELFFWPPHQSTLEVYWSLPMSALEKNVFEDGGDYRARLRGLIPVASFSLKVVLVPGCGYEMVKGGTNLESFPFNLSRGKVYGRKLGSCGLCIERKELDKTIDDSKEVAAAGEIK